MRSKAFFLMPCLWAALGICHRLYSYSYIPSFKFQKRQKYRSKLLNLFLSPLLNENAPRQRVRFQIMINLFFRH